MEFVSLLIAKKWGKRAKFWKIFTTFATEKGILWQEAS